jgi:hypothetical protein
MEQNPPFQAEIFRHAARSRPLNTRSRGPRMLDLPAAAQSALVAGARDLEPVKGLTHGFYKYPARFSPTFVRAAIEAFTFRAT